MPYRLYVPESYDPAVGAPLIVAVHISIGGAENPDWVAASRQQARTMREIGMTVEYLEPVGATHGSTIVPTTPDVFEFFSRHRKGSNSASVNGP